MIRAILSLLKKEQFFILISLALGINHSTFSQTGIYFIELSAFGVKDINGIQHAKFRCAWFGSVLSYLYHL